MSRLPVPRLLASLLLLSLASCSSAGPAGPSCDDGKCDKPDDLPPEEGCFLRRAEAIETAQRAFVRDAVRWACADVEGVNTNNQDDRGQEYCEYFAIVQPPPEVEGGEPAEPRMVGRTKDNQNLSVSLTEDQIFALEDDPDAVVGQCVFTSWHSDAPGPVPNCDGQAQVACPELFGFELSEQNFQMLDPINSNSAARLLVADCIGEGPAGAADQPEDPLHSDFYRGCMRCGDLFQDGLCVPWRRSDPSVCAAIMRLAECDCGLDVTGDGIADPVNLAEALIPPQPTAEGVTFRGFPLGTWSGQDELPGGCRYVEPGDRSNTVVSCDLTAGDLLASASDPKGRCREKFGDNVVVHVPIPADKIVCEPDRTTQYGATCSSEPWVVDN
jgi:hypothetical protein